MQNIITRDIVTNKMLKDLESILICTNDNVIAYCNERNWDIYDFIDLINEWRN